MIIFSFWKLIFLPHVSFWCFWQTSHWWCVHGWGRGVLNTFQDLGQDQWGFHAHCPSHFLFPTFLTELFRREAVSFIWKVACVSLPKNSNQVAPWFRRQQSQMVECTLIHITLQRPPGAISYLRKWLVEAPRSGLELCEVVISRSWFWSLGARA